MQKIVLELDKYNQYEPTQNNGETLWLLQYFLHDIQISSIPYYIEWSHDQTRSMLGCTNTTETNKMNGHVMINSLFSDEPDNGPFFIISISQFIKLLSEWKRVYELQPKKIIITEDNGIISIEAI